jgi:hypothetical protein
MSSSAINLGNLAATLSRSKKNLFVANWDAQLADFKCSQFTFKAPVATALSESDIFTRTALSSSSTQGKMRAIAAGTFQMFDINNPAILIAGL